MNITSKIQYKASVDADISYTNFEWSLHHWSLLYDDYKDSFKSPEFKIMQDDQCKCVITFSANAGHQVDDYYHKECTILEVHFSDHFQYHTLQAKVSITGNNKKKQCAVSDSRNRKIAHNSLTLVFGEVLEKDMANGYLEDDTLTLFFELYVVKTVIESPLRTNIWHQNFGTISRDKLKDIFKTGEVADFTFIVQKQEFPAHRLVLAANSDVFRAMLQTEMKEQTNGTVEIDNVNPKIFQIFLEYMYTGEVENIEEVASELVVLADKYQVTELIKACEIYMRGHLKIDNATQYLLTAHRLNLANLEKEAIQFIKWNTQILADPAEYKLLYDYPHLIKQIFVGKGCS